MRVHLIQPVACLAVLIALPACGLAGALNGPSPLETEMAECLGEDPDTIQITLTADGTLDELGYGPHARPLDRNKLNRCLSELNLD